MMASRASPLKGGHSNTMRVNWVCCEEGGAEAALRLRGLTQPGSEVKSETNILYMSQHIVRTVRVSF